ncbi:MAG: TetR family transcriptional regulator [Bifidobacteriaceae bacterium]|nr:TetR family transcriptional regulator [Bifidobacteriaceae bacterium]
MPKLIDHQARKEDLAQAVWDVIVHDGVGAVSVRTVAARAGVAVGSLRYMFPTRAELVAFSGELVLERASRRISSVPTQPDKTDYALAMLRELLPLTAETRAELLVNLALLAEAPAIPALVSIRDRTMTAIRDLCRRLITLARPELTGKAADQAANRLAALTDGLALRLLSTGEDSPDWALAILRAELTRQP